MLGHGFAFDIEVRKGAGAYICGEETAIFGSIEGYRGEPRNKPPFPVVEGLFRQPTVVNNVETLVNVMPIVLEGGPAFAEIGTEKSTGPKLFCVSGAVERPGTYEVPFGTTLRELFELAGGVPPNLRTVLLGGAAGMFITPEELDMRLTLEDARGSGVTLGSGVVLAIDDRMDLGRLLMVIAAFMRNESCGQCVPCRVGTVRQQEALARLLSGRTRGTRAGRARADRRDRRGDARRLDLRPGADGLVGDRVGHRQVGSVRMTQRMVSLTIDDQPVEVPEGSTIMQACAQLGIDTPTLCYGETLQPANACRVCVVELEGARVLAPACARPVEPDMVVKTDSERVRHRARWSWSSSRRRRTCRRRRSPRATSSATTRGPSATGRRRRRTRTATAGAPATTRSPTARPPPPCTPRSRSTTTSTCATTRSASSVTSASTPAATQWQNTFAITVAGRGFDARISTEFANPLPDSACVYCGNCIAVCPTGALMFASEHELREAEQWDESRQTTADTICPYCGVGCTLTLHVQDNEIVKVTLARRPRHHARQPLHQGPLRLPARPASLDREALQVRVDAGSYPG